jgi:hypothetical protein
MCLASQGQKQAATNAANLSNTMSSQASQIFGNTNQVFNNMMNSYQNIVAGGPNQQGFSQAELNSMNSQAITNNANQYRNVSGAAKAGQAGFGGGNTVDASGATTAANLGVAEAAAGNTANQLAGITQADYAQGNKNYFQAAGGESQLPGMFSAANSAGQVATGAEGENMQAQNAVASANNWWTQPVMSLVNAGGQMLVNGLVPNPKGNNSNNSNNTSIPTIGNGTSSAPPTGINAAYGQPAFPTFPGLNNLIPGS